MPCNLESNKTEFLDKRDGTLSYTNKIGSNQRTSFSYIIHTEGQLPLEVCNIPSTVKLNENESKNISFSGNIAIMPDEVDAISTKIELTGMKFIE